MLKWGTPLCVRTQIRLISNNLAFNLFQIERHLALGGSDNPGEIFFMFLFRYGHVNGFENIISSARTPLSQLMVIESKDGGSADMGGVFQVENCVRVFQECWRLLRSKLKQKVNPKHSILRFIVEADSLQRKRTLCSKKASLIERFATSSIRKQRLYYQIDTKMALLQRNGRDSATDSATRLQSRQPEAANTRADFDTDEEAEQINAGYGVTTKPKDSSKRKLNKNSKKSKIQGIQKRRKLEVQAATKTPGSDVKSSTKKVTMFQALGRPVEKMCLSTGRVLERFETGWAAAKDASTAKSVNKKLFKVLTGSFKGNQRVYNGYFWRWEGSNHVPR